MKPDILLYINPGAARYRPNLVQRIRIEAEKFGFIISPVSTAEQLVQRLEKEPPSYLGILGGDGTIHRLLPFLSEHTPPILLLPAGLGNELARSLFIPAHPISALHLLSSSQISKVWVGQIQNVLFANTAGTGIDALISLNRSFLPFPIPYLAYFLLLLPFLPSFPIRIQIDDREITGQFFWVLVGNGKYIGGGIPILPISNPCDRQLELFLLSAGSKWNILFNLPKALRGEHLSHPLIQTFPIKQAKLSLTRPTLFNIDGELYTFSGEIEIHGGIKSLRFISGFGK